MAGRGKACGSGVVAILSVLGCGATPWTVAGVTAAAVLVGAAPVAACPPSDGELFLQDYDPSGDGIVSIEGIEVRVQAKRMKLDDAGRATGEVEDKLALVLADPHRLDDSEKAHEAMVVRMPTRAAEELRDALKWSLERREARDVKPVEKKGADCTLLCKDTEGKTRTKLKIQNLVPTVADRREWIDDRGQKQVDERLTLTLSDWRAEKPPVSVSMDTESAKKFLAALNSAIDEKNGVVKPAAVRRPAAEI